MNETAPTFSLARRSSVLLNVAVSVGLVLALAAMLNYLAVRHYLRLHLAADPQTLLSQRTLQVLGQLTNEVQVTVYFDTEDDLYGLVTGLLKEYQFASPRIEVGRVDYVRDVAAAQAVKAKYKLTQVSDKNLVIFDCQGRTRMVSSTDLSEYDIKGAIERRTNEVRRTHFRGEMAFTAAIFSVSSPRALKAYFLRGHGEQNPESTDQAMGYSKFAAILKDECNIPWEPLSLLTAAEVPPDCSLLVIAGPVHRFSKEELDRLQKYLDQGGRLLALFNYNSLGRSSGLEKLLAEYSVAVGDNLVVDVLNSPDRGGKGIQPVSLGSHPITFGLQNSPICLYYPRAVRKGKSSGSRSSSAEVQELLFTGPNSLVVSDVRQGVPQMNPKLDQRGTVSLMCAVERGAVPGVSAERGATRLVVIGDSFFLQNDAIESGANRDFAAQVANWLVDQGVLISGVAPRPLKYYRMIMTQGQLAATRTVLLLGLPGAVLLVGAVVAWRRRS